MWLYEYFWIILVYGHLVYFILKVLAWEICNMIWGFGKNVIIKSPRQFMHGSNFYESDVSFSKSLLSCQFSNCPLNRRLPVLPLKQIPNDFSMSKNVQKSLLEKHRKCRKNLTFNEMRLALDAVMWHHTQWGRFFFWNCIWISKQESFFKISSLDRSQLRR